MPELAEVEVVRRVLINWVKNKTILDIDCFYNPILENVNLEQLKSSLVNKKIDDIKRYGKYLIFYIGEYALLSHLRMEGKYFYLDNLNNLSKHIHLVFKLDKGYLVYHDTRKFGKFYLTLKSNLFTNSPLTKLGYEPFEIEEKHLDNYIFEKFKNTNLTLKEALLDQSIMCGLGNIYADEVCFALKKYPFIKSNTLSLEEDKLVSKLSVNVLNKAISLGGSSVHSFSSGNHVDGKFQNELNVYGREKLNCKICGSVISRITIGGRSSCFCPNCQGDIKSKIVSKKPQVIGITGLIASGKSYVAKELANKLNYEYIDADEIVKLSYQNNEIVSKILEVFDIDYLDKDYIRNQINNNKEFKKELEKIIHPFVIGYIKNKIKENKNIIIEVPLLFESKLDKVCDLICYVYCENKTRLNRLKERNNTNFKDFSNLNNDENEIVKKMKLSDYIIDTSKGFDNSNLQINKLIDKINI